MFVQRLKVTVTTASDGSGVGYTDVVQGLLDRIQYDKPASGNFTDGVDFDVTIDETGEVLWDQDNVNADAVVAPRQATHSTTGAAALYAAAGEAVRDRIAINGRIKISIANGGDTKTGDFYITLC